MRPLPLWLVALAALTVPVPATLLTAQDGAPQAAEEAADGPLAGHSMHGNAFNEGPRQAARLIGGTGDVHFPITTVVPEAQRFFDQGVGQLHGFWYFEAERSFRQVWELDPDCTMAFWGMSMANINSRDRARAFARRAWEGREGLTRREVLWIEALAAFHGADMDPEKGEEAFDDDGELQLKEDKRDRKAKSRAYIKGLEALLREFPNEIEAKAFLAVHMWENGQITSHQAVDALLDQVFDANPMHPAHHYRIHLWDREASDRALRSAALIGPSAPSIAHMWHMAGHIYADLDRHADAAWQQEASARVDHANMIADRMMPHRIFNYGHNNEWCTRSLTHLGRITDALRLASNLAELPRHPDHNTPARSSHIAGYARRRVVSVLQGYELWDAILEAEGKGFLTPFEDPVAEGERLVSVGAAAYLAGRDGDRYLEAMDRLLGDAVADRAQAILEAESEAENDRKAVDAMKEALERETRTLKRLRSMRDQLTAFQASLRDGHELAVELAGKSRMPALLESLLLRRAGKHDEAVEKLARENERNPDRVEILARLVRAEHDAGKLDDARTHLQQLCPLAAYAELDNPLMQDVTRIAQELLTDELAGGADWRLPYPSRDDLGVRPPLDELGPFRWTPWAAPGFSLPEVSLVETPEPVLGSLDEYRGRPVVVVFFLGFGCLHCVEQLEAMHPLIGKYREAGLDVVAIGDQDMAASRQALADWKVGDDGEPWSIRLFSDPDHEVFRRWRCWDDFEDVPLHGTFLIDPAGRVRWQDISYEPFMEIDWLLDESLRLLNLPDPITAGAGSDEE